MTAEHPHRRIRSFVRREGRLTVGQTRALDELMPRFGLAFAEASLDLDAVFGRSAPRLLEIGCGDGESLATLAARHPEQDFIGVEVHRPGIGHLLLRVEELGLSNVRVICHDAVEVLERMIPPHALDALMLYFPDPWHKKRHHKRRIVQPAFAELVHSRLRPAGRFHLATDWEGYARHMLEVLEAAPGFVNAVGPGAFSPRPEARPQTKFERRGLRLGHGVWDLLYLAR